MSESVTARSLPSVDSARASVATIHPRWRRWSRVLWGLIALNSILTFALFISLTRQFADHLPARIVAGLSELGWTNDNYFWIHAVFIALSFTVFFVTGVLIFVLRPNERMAWFASILLIAYGGEAAYPLAVEFFATIVDASPIFRVVYLVNNLFSWGFLGAFLALFPDGRFVPRWSRWVALFGFFFSFGFGLFPVQFNTPQGPIFILVLVGGLTLLGGSLYAQVWRYRHYSTFAQKQQIKWLIMALAFLIFFTFLLTTLIFALLPTDQVSPATSVIADLIYFLANLSIVLFPLSIAIAIVRYRLWDIDIIIRKTLTYALVVALLAIVYFGIVILLQQIFANVTGQRSEVITVISTLAIAALFVPLRNQIQAVIDKRFYRKKYDAQQVSAKFAETVRDETDLDKLTGELLNVVQETMQPKSASVWLRPTNDSLGERADERRGTTKQ